MAKKPKNKTDVVRAHDLRSMVMISAFSVITLIAMVFAHNFN